MKPVVGIGLSLLFLITINLLLHIAGNIDPISSGESTLVMVATIIGVGLINLGGGE